MRFRMKRLGWFAMAALVCLLAIVAVPYLPSRESVPLNVLEEDFLANQQLTGQSISLNVHPIGIELDGSYSGQLVEDLEPSELHLVINRSFSITAVSVGGVTYESDPAWFSMSDPAEFRRFRRPRKATPPAKARPGLVEVMFKGPGLAATLNNPAQPVPLFFGSKSYATPKLTQESSDIGLLVTIETAADVSIDEEWTVFGENAERVEAAEGFPRYHLSAANAVAPGFALGPMLVEDIETSGGSIRVGRPHNSSFKEFAFQSAMDRVVSLLPGAVFSGLRVALSNNVTSEATAASNRGFWLCKNSDLENQLLMSLTRAALCRALPERPRELGPLPEILALLSLHDDDAKPTADDLQDLRAQTEDRGVFDGWVTLSHTYSSGILRQAIEEWVAALREGSKTKPRLFQERSVAALFRWLSNHRVDLVLDPAEVTEVANHYEAQIHARFSPAPKSNVAVAPPQLMIVFDDQVDVVELKAENGEFIYSNKSLIAKPRRFILDPYEQTPDWDRSNNISDLGADVEPAELAVAADSSSFAILPAFRQDDYGLYVFDFDASELAILSPRFFPVTGTIRNLSWLQSRKALFFESEKDEQVSYKLLDLEEQRVREFSSLATASPDGKAILVNESRAHDMYRHRVYFLDQRREIPFRNDISGKLNWIQGEGRLLGCKESGCEIFGYDGVQDVELPYAAAEVRDVQSNQRGLTFITETARGSKLLLLTRDSKLVELYNRDGRIRGYFPSEDSVDFYVFVEHSARDHLVYRLRPNEPPKRLYQGENEPLAHLHSIKGAIAVGVSQDRASQGIRELLFYPYDAEERILCDQVFLDVDPVLASGGRYLYYVRAEDGVDGVPARYRKRAPYRYDFLTEREEPLFPVQTPQ